MIDAITVQLPGKKKISYYAVGDIIPGSNGDKIIQIQRLENGFMIVTNDMKMRFSGLPYVAYEIRTDKN